MSSSAGAVPAAPEAEGTAPARFTVKLTNFEGPFDLLLQLIGKHKLDVTEIALSKVTDEFIAHLKALGDELDLDQASEFLVVASTLLDLKAARLLPSGEVEDAEDLALLDARDLLFARLLQYRAFKQVAELFGEMESAALRRYPRSVSLEDRYTGLLPEVLLGVGTDEFAQIAAVAFRPRPVPTVGLDHLHAPQVSVVEQAAIVLELLKARGFGTWTTFHELVADCPAPLHIVARFLALLELYRERSVEFEQPDPLGDLAVTWTGDVNTAVAVSDEDYQ